MAKRNKMYIPGKYEIILVQVLVGLIRTCIESRKSELQGMYNPVPLYQNKIVKYSKTEPPYAQYYCLFI
jgi:hypothetical protein